MMGSTQGSVVLLNLIISAVVLGIFGFWIFYWDIARSVLPDWLRIILLTGLFTHLIIRTLQSFRYHGFDDVIK
ncbi:MAG: hypothetical protein QXS02_02750 [Candidatus Thermoplasmatota archaeon]